MASEIHRCSMGVCKISGVDKQRNIQLAGAPDIIGIQDIYLYIAGKGKERDGDEEWKEREGVGVTSCCSFVSFPVKPPVCCLTSILYI
uniref:Uncharacterized protein n=1 Tax=Bracon brevicornis TaxID=1563983 RepID=A0A6V7LZN3_9HYME